MRDQKTIQSAPSSPALSESPFVDDGSAEDVEWESEDDTLYVGPRSRRLSAYEPGVAMDLGAVVPLDAQRDAKSGKGDAAHVEQQ